MGNHGVYYLDSYFSDEDDQIVIKGRYLPGYSSFQRSIDRYLIREKRNVTRSASQVRSAVLNSFSLKDEVSILMNVDTQYATSAKQWLNMLSDEELEEMKPYGEAFIREQDYIPQSVRSVPFPTDAYVRNDSMCL